MRCYKRKSEGFNIAFLDVMSCGLGAIILILMLVKYHSELPDQQSSALQADIARLELQKQQSQDLLDSLQNKSNAGRAQNAQLNAQLLQLVTSINTEKDAQQSMKKHIAELNAQVDTLPPDPPDPPAPITIVNTDVEDYLLGLKVEGEKIVLLVDSSASMTAERLIDIIRYKAATPQERQQSPKWQRTLRIIAWLIANMPADSEYQVIRFAEKAIVVGGSGWKKGTDRPAAKAVLDDFKQHIPEGGTNLHSAVATMHKDASNFTTVYLITDGLPTQGDARKLSAISSFFSGCTSIVGSAKKISGQCRAKLLGDIIATYKSRAAVNVILLGLEGDPYAAGAFWQWTARSGGLLISPESSWP